MGLGDVAVEAGGAIGAVQATAATARGAVVEVFPRARRDAGEGIGSAAGVALRRRPREGGSPAAAQVGVGDGRSFCLSGNRIVF